MNDLFSELPAFPRIGLRVIGFDKCGPQDNTGDSSDGGDGSDGADGGNTGGDGDQGGAQSGGDGDRGFPANTAVKDMKPEEQTAYWRFHDRRKSDTLKAYGGITPEEAKRLKDADEQRRREGLKPDERALEDARTEGAASAASQWAPEFAEEIAKQFVPNDEARASVMAGIDPLKFVKDGKFDRQGLADHLKGLQTAFGGGGSGNGSGNGSGGGSQPSQWGQGNGRKPEGTKESDAGLAEAKRRGYIKD